MNFDSLLASLKNAFQPKMVSPIPLGNDPTPTPTITNEKQRQLRLKYAKLGWKRPNMTPEEIAALPKATPTPVKTVADVLGATTENPAYKAPIPGGVDLALNYIKAHTPQGQAPESYYPALGDQSFMDKVKSADKIRQGVSNLLLAQGFLESTLGRGSSNIFGSKPGGKVSNFNSPSDSLDYQMGPNVLGGGANPNMNILNEGDNTPLTFDRILKLYKSYDPPGAYVNNLRDIFVK